eukprot:SAG22_NODE_6732_length_818_cov_1.212796_2_plen_44_part_01
MRPGEEEPANTTGQTEAGQKRENRTRSAFVSAVNMAAASSAMVA